MPRKKKNQRDDKRFCVRLDLGIVDGKRKRKSFYSYISLDDAKAKRDAYLLSQPASALPSERGITLSQWCERWLKAYKSGLSPNGYSDSKTSSNRLCRFVVGNKNLGSFPISNIKPAHISEYIMSLANMSKSTIRKSIITTRQIFDAAVNNHMIIASPVHGITPPKGKYVGHRVISHEEKALILNTWKLHRCGLWAVIMQYAGLRRGEVAALQWENIDLEKREIHVRQSLDLKHKLLKETKSNAGLRTIPILKPLYNVLKEIYSPSLKGNICVRTNGAQLTEMSYRRAWESYMLMLERAANNIYPYEKTLGWRKDISRENPAHVIIDIDAHDLRYTFASYLYDNDVDIKTAQYLMGHASLDMTLKIYTKLSQEKKTKSINRLIKNFDELF